MSKGNLPLAEGGLEWADSVTVKPKAELLQSGKKNLQKTLYLSVQYAYNISCEKKANYEIFRTCFQMNCRLAAV